MHKTIQHLVARYPHLIEEVSMEGRTDGYWLYLKPGWKREPCDEVHSVHEWNARDLVAAMRRVVPCECDECRRLAASKAVVTCLNAARKA
jgi:hypothetical protein